MEQQEPILIWTDGARVGNPNGGPGGWAYVATRGGKTRTDSGGIPAVVTGNQMELLAAIQALRGLKRADLPVVVHSDSKYLVNGMSGWLQTWIARGWRNSDGDPTANRELWEELLALVGDRPPSAQITFVWVRGHSGVAANEQADRLANAAAREAAKKPGAAAMPSKFDPESGLIVPVFDAEDA